MFACRKTSFNFKLTPSEPWITLPLFESRLDAVDFVLALAKKQFFEYKQENSEKIQLKALIRFFAWHETSEISFEKALPCKTGF